MDNTELEKLNNNIYQLKTQVNKLSDDLKERTDFQLKEPLDNITEQIIRNRLVIPVTFTLPGSLAATGTYYDLFFIANRSYIVESATCIFRNAGTSSSAVTLDIYKGINGTTGVTILETQFNLKGTPKVYQEATLKNNSSIELKKGDPLSLVLFGTPTSIDQLVVTVYLKQK